LLGFSAKMLGLLEKIHQSQYRLRPDASQALQVLQINTR
jgi:hypothetical protein